LFTLQLRASAALVQKERPTLVELPRPADSEELGIGSNGYDSTLIGRVSKPKNSNGLSVGIIH
jgi:hypothetical protein